MTLAGIISALSCRCLDELVDLLGPAGSEALSDLQQLWRLAEGYGYKDWLVFDASVVRGLAYYTGAMTALFVLIGVAALLQQTVAVC